jgi:hypothetical protein
MFFVQTIYLEDLLSFGVLIFKASFDYLLSGLSSKFKKLNLSFSVATLSFTCFEKLAHLVIFGERKLEIRVAKSFYFGFLILCRITPASFVHLYYLL